MVPPHTLVGGGTGFIGKRLVKHLKGCGYKVTVISRTACRNRLTWNDLEKNGIPKDVTSVVNVAGQNVLDPSKRWTSSFRQDVWNSRISTNAALAKAVCKATNVCSMVNISGVSAYPPPELNGDINKEYTEFDPPTVFNYMSKLCVEMEKASDPPKDSQNKCKHTKIRTGVVLGREGGMIESIWLPFQLGLGGPMGSGKQILPWIHIEDLVRLIQHSIENEKCAGILHGVAPEMVTNGEFSKIFARTLKRPCLFAVPEYVVNIIFGEERSALLLTGARICPKRTLDTGFQYKYPTVKEACLELIK